MLVQVAGKAQRIDPQLLRQLGDPAHRIAKRLPRARHHWLGPGEGRVKMHVRKQQSSHWLKIAPRSDKICRAPYLGTMTVRVTGLISGARVRTSSVRWPSTKTLGLARYASSNGDGAKCCSPRYGSTTTIIDIIAAPAEHAGRENVDHFCLVVEPTDWDAVSPRAVFELVSGPAEPFGPTASPAALYPRP